MVDILHKFKRELEKNLKIEIIDEKLKKTIHLYNQIRKVLEDLYLLTGEDPDILAGSDVYAIMKAAMVMDRDVFFQHVIKIVSELYKAKQSGQKCNRKRIVLAGGICNHPNIYSILEESGGQVVWDDLCTGSRYLTGQIDETDDPINSNNAVRKNTPPLILNRLTKWQRIC